MEGENACDDPLPTNIMLSAGDGQQNAVTTSSKKRGRPTSKGLLQEKSFSSIVGEQPTADASKAAVPSKPTSSFREAHKRRQYLIPEEV